MTPALSLADPSVLRAIHDAFDAAGQATLVFIRDNLGAREWWLVSSRAELAQALGRVGSNHGRSDAVEIYAPSDFMFLETDALLKQRALQLLALGDVVLAYKRTEDPELHDVMERDQIEDVEEWLRTPRGGNAVLGPHPLLTHDAFYPQTTDSFLAYGPLADGSVVIGSY